MIVDCALYRNGRRAEGAKDLAATLRLARAEEGSFLWLGLHDPDATELDRIARELGLHPLAVEDALHAHQRPKLEAYEGSLFVVLKPVAYDTRTDSVTASELMLFLGDSFVVTVRHGDNASLGELRERLEHDDDALRHGPTAVLHTVADFVVDHYLDVATELQTDLDALETLVFAPDGGARDTASRIYDFKRQIQEFRRATVPLLGPLVRLSGSPDSLGSHAALPFVDPSARPFFRDVTDHLARVHDSVESLDRLVSDVLSAHLAQMSVRQNDDMRKISAWAAMAAVPTMIAGVYGMNFDHMPELHWPWSYPVCLALMVLLEVLLYRLFKRRGWL